MIHPKKLKLRQIAGYLERDNILIYFNFQRKSLFCDENGDPNLDTLLEEGMAVFVLGRGDNDNLMGGRDPGNSFIYHGDK